MADNREILKLIEEKAKEGRLGLYLRGNELSSLPPEIGKLTMLGGLDVSGNNWKRFGTQTVDGRTGTEHELSLAYERGKKEAVRKSSSTSIKNLMRQGQRQKRSSGSK